MLKIESIILLKNYKILCQFNTGEKRLLDLEQILDGSNKYFNKIKHDDVFTKARIGAFGEIVWDEVGEIKELNGSISSREYDISPEFAYYNSSTV